MISKTNWAHEVDLFFTVGGSILETNDKYSKEKKLGRNF
jgi:hypothetical protein